jgi:hypothetical protein
MLKDLKLIQFLQNNMHDVTLYKVKNNKRLEP